MLRKIFGPTKERDGTWRIKTKDELDELMTQEYNKSHKSTKIKLVLSLTTKIGRKDIKKSL